MYSLEQLAKYPFIHEAKRYMQKEAPTIQELLKDPLYDRARSNAIERLENAFEHKDVGNRALVSETDCIMELLSYPLARMIVVSIHDAFFTRRYALGESVHMYKNLLREPSSFISKIAVEFSININTESESDILVYFTDYLHFAPTRYKKWKMINRQMTNGYISITNREFARLIQEALRLRINNELEEKLPNELASQVFQEDIQRFRRMVQKIKDKIDSTSIRRLDVEKLPPCLHGLLTSIQAGDNVPHMGRFTVVAFLNSLQLSVTDIIKLFSSAPDFEEERTRYQIENITGTSGSTSYKSPGCGKMKTYGLCPLEKRDAICKTINHPMSYYKKRWKQMEKKKT